MTWGTTDLDKTRPSLVILVLFIQPLPLKRWDWNHSDVAQPRLCKFKRQYVRVHWNSAFLCDFGERWLQPSVRRAWSSVPLKTVSKERKAWLPRRLEGQHLSHEKTPLLAWCFQCERVLYLLLHWKTERPTRWWSAHFGTVYSFIFPSYLAVE